VSVSEIAMYRRGSLPCKVCAISFIYETSTAATRTRAIPDFAQLESTPVVLLDEEPSRPWGFWPSLGGRVMEWR
jgi:hypothetical protein